MKFLGQQLSYKLCGYPKPVYFLNSCNNHSTSIYYLKAPLKIIFPRGAHKQKSHPQVRMTLTLSYNSTVTISVTKSYVSKKYNALI